MAGVYIIRRQAPEVKELNRKFLIFPLLAILLLGGFSLLINQTFGNEESAQISAQKEKGKEAIKIEGEPAIVKALKNDFLFQYSLFKKASLEGSSLVYADGRYKIYFTVNPTFQREIEKEFSRFKVKYGAYVALEPETGRVLAAVSSLEHPDLTLKRSYPTASTFKIITSAAALELGIAKPDTALTCGGVGDSCSPSVWLNSRLQIKRSFSQSFATSANPFFGNLGRLIGKENLLKYARLFGFNDTSYNFPWGVLREPLDDYELALMAAGLGDTTASPFHEALISQTVVNGGVMMKPLLVDRVMDLKSGKVYAFKPEPLRRVISPQTAAEIERMMVLTVKIGTVSDKRHFRRLKRKFPELVIGGKSGTLTERSYPEGRCEWFTGFFSYGGKKVAFSSVAVNNWLYYISGYEIGAVAAESFAKLMKKEKGGVKCASSVR